MVDELSDEFAAFYFSGEDRILMAVPDEGLAPEDGVYVLAHEMVHAHQHRQHDLASGSRHVPESLDGSTAFTALVEGEAILDSNILLATAYGLHPSRLDWDGYFGTWTDETRRQVASAPSRFPVAVRLLPYPVGGLFVFDTHRRLGMGHVRALWQSPPPSFAHFVRRARTLDTFGTYDTAPLACGLPPPPDGLERVGTDAFGATVIFAWLVAFQETLAAWDAAVRTTGDQIAVYGGDGEAGRVAFAWRLRGVEVAEAARFTP